MAELHLRPAHPHSGEVVDRLVRNEGRLAQVRGRVRGSGRGRGRGRVRVRVRARARVRVTVTVTVTVRVRVGVRVRVRVALRRMTRAFLTSLLAWLGFGFGLAAVCLVE